MRGRRLWLFFLVLLVAFLCRGASARAMEPEELEEEQLEQYDYGEIDEALEELFPEERLDFGETLGEVLSGDVAVSAGLLNRLVYDQFFYALGSCRENLGHILLIAVIAAVFSNFSGVFQSRQISEISFYLLYLLLVALCLNSFQAVLDWVGEGVEALTTFMGAFCPVYFLAVAVAKGSVTAVAFYNLVLFLIYLAQMVIAGFLLPVIHIYFIVQVLNFLSREDYLSKLAGVLHMGVAWALKTVLADADAVPVVIFDDSLSAVDAETDAKIRAALHENLHDATVILISHRVTTLMKADQILVLQDGRRVDLGTHAELISRPGIYRDIYDIQMSSDDRKQLEEEEAMTHGSH